jgi:hypothetical protein
MPNNSEIEIVVGITGTQTGLTDNQRKTLEKTFKLFETNFKNFHLLHGDCVGVDCEAHCLYLRMNFGGKIIIFPPKNNIKRAYCTSLQSSQTIILPEEEYLVRNKNIVQNADILIACPKEENGEMIRSGTWFTVRYAKNFYNKIILIRPSGKIEILNDN